MPDNMSNKLKDTTATMVVNNAVSVVFVSVQTCAMRLLHVMLDVTQTLLDSCTVVLMIQAFKKINFWNAHFRGKLVVLLILSWIVCTLSFWALLRLIDFWKTESLLDAECRQFLLYTGPIIMRHSYR